MTTTRVATPLAVPVDLSQAWNASDDDVAARFDPSYRPALPRLPEGDVVVRGLPLRLGSRTSGRRWLLLDREIVVDLRGRIPATHLVVAHFSDSWRDEAGLRPAGTPVGWVVGVGEALAAYAVVDAVGERREFELRRRHQIDDGIIGWGSLPFAAIGHREDQVIDWRGPHPRQSVGRYAPAGQSGPLTILPGAWGVAQTGVADFVPTPDDDVTLWLHAIPLGGRMTPVQIRLRPLGGGRPGAEVVVAALTLFDGTADPLVLGPRRQLRIEGRGMLLPEIDLGIAIRSRPLSPPGPAADPFAPIGWGTTPPGAGGEEPEDGPSVVDVAVAPDARLRIGDWVVPAADLVGPLVGPGGSVRIEPLAPTDVRVRVEVVDARSGTGVPARVRFVASDGRYLPPVGHRDEVNPGIYEDTGADLVLGRETYAYVPGSFDIDMPAGRVEVEVVKGFDHRPVRRSIDIGPDTRAISIPVERVVDLRPRGWVTADPHVHFLAPSTALLQAAAEDVGIVHVLATQWGDQFTNVTDLPWGSLHDPSGRHAVIVGTENRQNMLGHVGLLGAHRPILPMAAGGAPEGRIAGAVTELLADWADRCHAEGGLVVASHFPLPYAEVASDIVMGRVDVVEMQTLPPGFDTPSILEWYRYLDCGYRLPVVGGTDKMSAEVPVGGTRTYARLQPGEPLTFDAWAAALRAGRTFASSGSVIELDVDGHEPGDVLSLPASGGRLEVHVRARAAQRIVTAVELVVNGRVVASREAPAATDDLELVDSVDVRAGSWIAARARSDREINSAFATSMAAHTSPVYVEVVDHPLFAPSDAAAILEIIEGTLTWIRDAAAVARPSDRARMIEFIASSRERLRDRMARATGGSPR